MKKKISIIWVLLLCSSLYSVAQTATHSEDYSLFKKDSLIENGMKLPYRILYPENYDVQKKYPLLIFLHGSGERGNDNEKQLLHGGNWLIKNFRKDNPAIVIVPQCSVESFWANCKRETVTINNSTKSNFIFYKDSAATPAMQLLLGLTKNWILSGKIDTQKIYIGGLSMGGMATYEMLIRCPKTFAAAIVICGAVDINWFKAHDEKIPLWLFHGDADAVVSVEYSRQIFSELNDGKRIIKYTEYHDVKHNCWDNVFLNNSLPGWLLSKSVSNTVTAIPQK